MFDLKGYGPALAEGAVITIELAFLSLALALALGLVGASAKLSGSRVAAGIATAYTTLIRGVPDLVMMLLFYYGGQVAVNMLSDYLWETRGIDFFFQFDPFISGVVTIGLTDMVRVAEEAAKAERMPFHFFVPVAAVYLALTAGSELFIKWLDRRANVGVVQGN